MFFVQMEPGSLPADVDEAALMAAAATGDRHAFTRLVERLIGRVAKLCARATSPEHAEELTQETFTRLWLARTNFRPGTNVQAFVFTIALNLCRNHQRSRARTSRALSLVDPSSSPNALPESLGDRGRLQTALEALSPDHREALVLRYCAGLEGEALAEALECNASTARSRIFFALKRVRALLGVSNELSA